MERLNKEHNLPARNKTSVKTSVKALKKKAFRSR